MPEIPAVPRTRGLTERVAEVFAPEGPLAGAFDGFEPRPGQSQLARAVADTFSATGILAAEAGTGTGKTLAYLVPAVLAGRRVLISTGTRNLQDQIFYKDIPALSAALGHEIRAAYMKGRTNYLCLHRHDRLVEAEAGLPPAERAWLTRVTEWASETETGDRAEIEDMPDDLPFWSELTATSEQCLGRECPRVSDCHVFRMRERAAESEVVIVNHHLLCADASVRQGQQGGVIPDCDLAVIDEAHQLEDVVTQYFGISLSNHKVDQFARDATQATALIPPEQGLGAVAMAHAIGEVQHAARAFFDSARLALRMSAGSGDRVTLTADLAEHLRPHGRQLIESCEAFVSSLRGLPELHEDLAAMIARAATIVEDVRVLLAADDPAFVHFIEARGRGAFLRAAPIDVAALVRDTIIGDRLATVLTSATMTVEGRFDYVLARLGLSGATTLRLPSEFDFQQQAILYLPPDMPEPRAPEFNARAARIVSGLLECTSGRAFVLFTSYAAMREVHGLLEGRVDWPLFVQGTAPRTALLRDFRATPHAVLLATSSFWQGVDVAGEALSCVVIDRLPFASPADPLVAARIAAIQARGGHAFSEYQVPLATLTLLQGLGRLIRTRTDRGVLAILDPRLTRMSYGRRFMASLPDAPITDDLEVVRRFFASSS